MLWGRAASRCAFPACRRELVMDATETDDESLVGEACHIVARSIDGPRGTSYLTPKQRDKYGNLLLLCSVHHKIIDDQPNEYSIKKLNDIKRVHESWVSSQLEIYDPSKQRDDEVYASYIEKFECLTSLDNWSNWTRHLLSNGQPKISKEQREQLEELRTWLLNRVWPNRYVDLELAFENFRRILQDLLNSFDKHSIEFREHSFITEKFYKSVPYHDDKKLHKELFNQYEYHCDLIEDLSLELNRAVNYVCDKIRENILHGYRLEEGVLLIISGPHMDMSFHTHRAEYQGDERLELPYLGLKLFSKEQRFTRDLFFGEKA